MLLPLQKHGKQQGLTQRELAERSGVPQSTIARIERGYNTSIDTLSKIAFALNKRVKNKFYIYYNAPIMLYYKYRVIGGVFYFEEFLLKLYI